MTDIRGFSFHDIIWYFTINHIDVKGTYLKKSRLPVKESDPITSWEIKYKNI